jgi:hypothetical protein
MKIYAVLIIVIFSVVAGCKPCKKMEVIDIGDLTSAQLALVPYTDGQLVQLKHSGGLIIDYTVSRSTKTETREYSGYCETLKYQVNTTSMIPSYPVLPITIYVANTDYNYTAFEASIGKYFYFLPKDPADFNKYGEMRDLVLNDTTYRDVFLMKTPGYSHGSNEIIYVDSLLYNYTSGVIKIIMSNGENYALYE